MTGDFLLSEITVLVAFFERVKTHDEIVIRHSNRFTNPHDEMAHLERTTKLSFKKFEDSRGWPPGTLKVDILHL